MHTLPSSLPLHQLRTERRGEQEWAWDPVRRKYILLTPEEWVRQNLIMFLTETLQVPRGLISLERGLQYNRLSKRFDLLVFGRDGKPALLCECKSPFITLDEKTVRQAYIYNRTIQAGHVMVTNGKELHWFHRQPTGRYRKLESVGEFWRED